MAQAKDDEDTVDMKLYVLLANLRSSGDRDYHNLTSTYLTANSILVAAIGILLNQGLIVGHYISTILSIVGITICLQMSIAQGRFRAQNIYWERNLRIIEDNSNWNRIRFFNELYEFREKNKILPQVGDVPELKPNFAIKHHQKFWAPRMKSLPWLFGIIFLFFLVWSVLLTSRLG